MRPQKTADSLKDKITIQAFADKQLHQGKTILISKRPRRINGWTR